MGLTVIMSIMVFVLFSGVLLRYRDALFSMMFSCVGVMIAAIVLHQEHSIAIISIIGALILSVGMVMFFNATEEGISSLEFQKKCMNAHIASFLGLISYFSLDLILLKDLNVTQPDFVIPTFAVLHLFVAVGLDLNMRLVKSSQHKQFKNKQTIPVSIQNTNEG